MYNAITDSIYFPGKQESGCKICHLSPNEIPCSSQSRMFSQVHYRCSSLHRTFYGCLTQSTFQSSFGFLWASKPVALQSQVLDPTEELILQLQFLNRRVTNSRQRYNAFYGYVTGNILLDRK